ARVKEISPKAALLIQALTGTAGDSAKERDLFSSAVKNVIKAASPQGSSRPHLMTDYSPPKRCTRWMATIFMPAIALVGIVGTPLYIYSQGLAFSEAALFLFYLTATSFAITVGYHRFYSHATFKTNPFINFLLLFFGAATFQKSALRWASQHRQHHQFTDTDLDPHNSKRGVFYCHMGWIMLYKHNVNFKNVTDLSKNRLIGHQHQYYDLWSVTAGLILPLLIGAWIGHFWGTFIMTFCLRVTLILNMAFLINSSAHMIGDKNFDKEASAGDSWFWAFFTQGEGYHNYHHRFPNDYRSGHQWYAWDPSKWFIYVLSRLGLAWDLKKTSPQKIAMALSQ
ncbi:MAG TPA: fatty acid desaturase, partial [bacterium]|nr:fatty acid desaturase [bacterium]